MSKRQNDTSSIPHICPPYVVLALANSNFTTSAMFCRCPNPSDVRYLHEAGYTVNGQIGCTQPRRVAAVLGSLVPDAIRCRMQFRHCVRPTSPRANLETLKVSMRNHYSVAKFHAVETCHVAGCFETTIDFSKGQWQSEWQTSLDANSEPRRAMTTD